MIESAVWTFTLSSILSLALMVWIRAQVVAKPARRSLYLFRINCALLTGAVLLVFVRYCEELAVLFALGSRHPFALVQAALDPFYGVLLIAHLWANRDFYRPRKMDR